MDVKLLDAGVEHLLRDVKDSTVSNLSSEVSHMASGLRALKSRLSEVQEYLNLVLEGRLPVNHDIMYHLQVNSCSITVIPALLNLQVQGRHVCWLLTCCLDGPDCMIVVYFNMIGSLDSLFMLWYFLPELFSAERNRLSCAYQPVACCARCSTCSTAQSGKQCRQCKSL